MKNWLFLGVLIAVGGITTHYVWARSERSDYCHLACTDARACSIALPSDCEDHCMRGNRELVLPETCSELETEINTKGYLW